MNILHIAEHSPVRGNDDEGAISDALTQLGHTVTKIEEANALDINTDMTTSNDVVLFHQIKGDWPVLYNPAIKRVLWHWDEVTDNTLIDRLLFAQKIDLALLTHGPTVDLFSDYTDKIDILRQGFDQRYKHQYKYPNYYDDIGIFGSAYPSRESFFEDLNKHYPWDLTSNGIHTKVYGLNGQNYVHQEKLESLVNTVKIWPQFDCTLGGPYPPNYWSNRPYLLTGMGAFIIHPYCEDLAKEYLEDYEMVFYKTREELWEKIQFYLDNPEDRENIRIAGQQKTLRCYKYIDRCKQLIEFIQTI
jgi:hypothetical protein